MAHIKTLPYNHFDPCKPTLRITYHSNGTKTEQRNPLRPTPSLEMGQRFRDMAAQTIDRLERDIVVKRTKGEYDSYDMTRNQYIEEPHKEI